MDAIGSTVRLPTPASRRHQPQAPIDRVELGAEVVPPRLEAALKRAGLVYYDAGADQKEQRRYYGGLLKEAEQLSPEQLFSRLSELVTETHTQPRSYEPDEYVYQWVDLRPNLRLKCLYDPTPVTTDAPVRAASQDYDTPALEKQAQQWAAALSQGPTNALQLAQKIAEIETRSVFNCEHVVPRIWFGNRAPMRGDMHHLFTANQATNAERSSRRLFDFPDYDGSDGKGLAPFRDSRYEPAAGKGEVARATLYFLLRYPRKIGDDPRELHPEDLETLRRWNREFPPTLHERHRNQAIQELQGNRNPFIDHPEWADRIDFTLGLQRPMPEHLRRSRRQGQSGPKPTQNQKTRQKQRSEPFRPESSRRPKRKRHWSR